MVPSACRCPRRRIESPSLRRVTVPVLRMYGSAAGRHGAVVPQSLASGTHPLLLVDRSTGASAGLALESHPKRVATITSSRLDVHRRHVPRRVVPPFNDVPQFAGLVRLDCYAGHAFAVNQVARTFGLFNAAR